MKTDALLDAAFATLQRRLEEFPSLALAVSGGVDSMTLAWVAHRANPRAQVFHALSPAVPPGATERVRRYAESEGWELRLVDAGEMQDPRYLRNPVNRCYFCKSNLYATLRGQTSSTLVSGTNLDDLGDYRPGLQAAAEQGVVHPLVDAGIGKAGVRALAARFGLRDLQELPAAPCLSSRVSTGIPIAAGLLPLIDRSEERVRLLLAGERVPAVRCRVRRDHLSIELDTCALLDASFPYRGAIEREVREVFKGSPFAALAARIRIERYRRGSAFIRVSHER